MSVVVFPFFGFSSLLLPLPKSPITLEAPLPIPDFTAPAPLPIPDFTAPAPLPIPEVMAPAPLPTAEPALPSANFVFEPLDLIPLPILLPNPDTFLSLVSILGVDFFSSFCVIFFFGVSLSSERGLKTIFGLFVFFSL